MDYGVTSMTTALKRVAVRPPDPRSDFARAHWAQPLDIDLLLDQHAAFVGILERLDCDVVMLPPLEGLPDSRFTYDPAFVVNDGGITLRAAKDVRVGEGERLAADLAAVGVPTIAALTGGGGGGRAALGGTRGQGLWRPRRLPQAAAAVEVRDPIPHGCAPAPLRPRRVPRTQDACRNP